MKKVLAIIGGVAAAAGLILAIATFHAPSSGGNDTGYVSAIDEEFWGTYTVYLRYQPLNQTGLVPAEENERSYCIDAADKLLVDELRKVISDGSRVVLNYEKIGFGFKWRNECHSSPIKGFEIVRGGAK